MTLLILKTQIYLHNGDQYLDNNSIYFLFIFTAKFEINQVSSQN